MEQKPLTIYLPVKARPAFIFPFPFLIPGVSHRGPILHLYLCQSEFCSILFPASFPHSVNVLSALMAK